jgi:hypothetical protein
MALIHYYRGKGAGTGSFALVNCGESFPPDCKMLETFGLP